MDAMTKLEQIARKHAGDVNSLLWGHVYVKDAIRAALLEYQDMLLYAAREVIKRRELGGIADEYIDAIRELLEQPEREG